MDTFDKDIQEFAELCQNPVLFLNGDDTASAKCIDLCSNLYSLAKSSNELIDDPLSQLLIKGFDDEQIWQQIDIFNEDNVKICSKGYAVCLCSKSLSLETAANEVTTASFEHHDSFESESEMSDDGTEENEDIEQEEGSGLSDSDEDENNTADDDAPTKTFERTEVDDDFFSLRQMEQFLEKEEARAPNMSDDEIDYFNEVPSDDDEDKLSDFSNDDESVNATSNQDHISHSARQLKYKDFFPGEPLENNDAPKEEMVSDSENIPKSNFEKQQLQMSKKINQLQERALEEADWQMKGETMANKRPVNSLLEEVLTFDSNERVAPEITDEHTHDLEAIISQRIKDNAWDDVERKIKEIRDPQEYKKKVVLDSEKSKLSLQEIYEKEYVAKTSNEEKSEKEDPAHIEIKSMMSELFKKLDALSNFHFRTAPPDPEIKVVTNLPSIAMEEVQPVTHTDADLLAPEEIAEKKEIKAKEEKSSTDRKRERRQKSSRQKAYHKAKIAKLEMLADTNEKLKTVQALKQLQQSAKNPRSQTTIIKNSKTAGDKIKTSKSFFSKLEEVKTNTNGHLKRKIRS